jgi:multisubunit Na+/H+ antiporter MnhB subunit
LELLLILIAPLVIALTTLFITYRVNRALSYVFCGMCFLIGTVPFIYHFYAKILNPQYMDGGVGELAGVAVIQVIAASMCVGGTLFTLICLIKIATTKNITKLAKIASKLAGVICRRTSWSL